ncbi:hypothetical protein LSH36_645g01059 [Paralvinella palmiformis]|uniref:GHMP kinase N-terminal domain-containing protein n=1 Tax=Paralvinella palmiformis TaxID=53620 RepID=A0AAD9MWT9_9ANNE|nr:hypothetical protein LSH36_645g01059 [Paralvinella palmiformis]
MAIEQDIVIAVARNSNKTIQLANSDLDFSQYTCNIDDLVIDKTNPKWYHYFLCGCKGILDHFTLTDPVGLCLMVDGTVPRSAGLSSSSAFVCAAALATMQANNKQCTKLELADICQHCEKYIGTEGGGMDQSIAFLAEPGTAKLIQFNPIRATDINLPPGAVFVISNSCVQMSKAITSHFNTRVMECRLAAKLLAKSKGFNWKSVQKLGDVQMKFGVSLKDMLQIVKDILHREPYDKNEICSILDITTEELDDDILNEKTRHVHSKLLPRYLVPS